ncbi:hypothetical protein LQK89_17670 (plasmid) [Curtobacterium sp. C1]|uniref:hypothetical protein n=1 Tax=Curtobacterium sp. C1 TaxID=2898151 RepID=UPI001E4E4472|nr:hypothetical protein [Curtobacterium sp. C1]UFU16050.1 hypothetical protein LQK89_17670 [Curtobacterium sp. C1]
MTQFYEVRDSDQNLVWIAAHETAGEHRIFVYLPNTGTWQHSTAVEDDFYGRDHAATYTPITAEQAVRQLPTMRKLNAKSASWLLEELTSSATATSSELGLPVATTARPTSEAQVIEILAKNDGGRWVKVYSGRTSGAARSFASELRNGKKARINRIGRFETRVVHETVVEARRIVEKASA